MFTTQKLRPILTALLVVGILAASGYALSQAGLLNLPFLSSGPTEGFERGPFEGGDSEGRSTVEAGGRPEGDRPGGFAGEGGSLSLAQFGGVLFNLWFIAFVTTLVVYLPPILRFTLRQVRRTSAA